MQYSQPPLVCTPIIRIPRYCTRHRFTENRFTQFMLHCIFLAISHDLYFSVSNTHRACLYTDKQSAEVVLPTKKKRIRGNVDCNIQGTMCPHGQELRQNRCSRTVLWCSYYSQFRCLGLLGCRRTGSFVFLWQDFSPLFVFLIILSQVFSVTSTSTQMPYIVMGSSDAPSMSWRGMS